MSIKNRPRVLLLEGNRYQALLIERRLSEQFPDGMVTVFAAPGAALRELNSNGYDVVVASADTLGAERDDWVGALRVRSEHLPVILLTADDDPRPPRLGPGLKGVHYLARSEDSHKAAARLVIELLGRSNSDRTEVSTAPRPAGESVETIRATAGALAHEINNPLQTILGMTELLLDENGRLDPEVARRIRIVRRSAGRIAASLKRLSAASGAELQGAPPVVALDPESPVTELVPAE
jgi:signal transduction histidine kinase